MSLALFECISGTKLFEKITYFGHPLFGSWWIQRRASSWYENFWVDVQEFKNSLEVEFFSFVHVRFFLTWFDNDDRWEVFDIVVVDNNGIAASDDTKIEFFLEGHTQSFVDHRNSFLIGKEEDLGYWWIFCEEGFEVGIGDFDHVWVEVLGSCFLDFCGVEFSLIIDKWNGIWWVDFEGGEFGDSLLFTEFVVLIAVDGSDFENASVLVGPGVEGWYEIFGFAIWTLMQSVPDSL